MKTQKMTNTILLLSILLFNNCSKDEIKINDLDILGPWIGEEYHYSFLFTYNQGFELLEDNTYHPIHINQLNGDTTITKEVTGNWNLNEAKDSLTFTELSTNNSISFHVINLTNDSLLLYGKAYTGSERIEHLFIKKKNIH